MSSFRLCALSGRSLPLACTPHSTSATSASARAISSSSVQRLGGPGRARRQEGNDEDGDGNKDDGWQPRSRRLRTRGWDRNHPPELIGWLTAGEGKQFEFAKGPRNWLGGRVPFPLNPSFKPPTPLSNELRDSIFTMHMANPEVNTARKLSYEYGLSISRIEAILKLKFLEVEWRKEGKVIQTGFVKGMEHLLGVEQDARTLKAKREAESALEYKPPPLPTKVPNPYAEATQSSTGDHLIQLEDGRKLPYHEVVSPMRADVQAADFQVEEEGEQGLRDRERYRRMYWESVEEGEAPIVPEEVENARKEGKQRRNELWQRKSNPVLLTGSTKVKLRAAKLPKTVVVERPNRPAIKFVDVGGKFLDVEAATKRVRKA